MTHLDTLSIKFPDEAVRRVNPLAFSHDHTTDPETGVTTEKWKAKAKWMPIGVSQLHHVPGSGGHVVMSAKVLGQDYLDGINPNNWDRGFHAISEIIDIDTKALWDYDPIINRCDTTDNISLEALGASHREVCKALKAAKSNSRFIVYPYQSKTEMGVVLKGTQKRDKNRLLCYDKRLDLLKSDNRDFLKSIPNPIKMLKDAEGITRVEVNHTTYSSMRARFKVSQNTLQGIMGSHAKVNHDFLKKAMGQDTKVLSLFSEYESMDITPVDFIRAKGMESIYHHCERDEIQMREFLKQLFGERFNYYFYKSAMPLKDLIKKIKAKDAGFEQGRLSQIIIRLLSELEAA